MARCVGDAYCTSGVPPPSTGTFARYGHPHAHVSYTLAFVPLPTNAHVPFVAFDALPSPQQNVTFERLGCAVTLGMMTSGHTLYRWST